MNQLFIISSIWENFFFFFLRNQVKFKFNVLFGILNKDYNKSGNLYY